MAHGVYKKQGEEIREINWSWITEEKRSLGPGNCSCVQQADDGPII